MRLFSLFVVCLSATACTDNPADPNEAKLADVVKPADWLSPVGPVPVFEQRPGDPHTGRHALLHESYVNCGLPERVFRELQSSASGSASGLGLGTVVDVTGRDAAMDGLPYNTNRVIGRSGIPIVSSNCLSCHGTVLFGELVIGLGNEFADFTQNPSVAVERAGALLQGDAEAAEWTLFADRIAAIAPYIQTRTVGVNPAPNLTGALVAHRDVDTHAWMSEPQMLMPPTDPPPVSVPPWWRMQKKHAMFNLSEGRDDHARFMLAASMLCADSVAELDQIDEYAPDVRAYLSSIEPPAYPFEIDRELAQRGEQPYLEHCSSCHGTYGADPSYPNTVTAIDAVKTDARLLEVATGEFGREFVGWFNASWFGLRSKAAPAKGYVAPPLDGIWATAPFLHNGSVPNLATLLSEDQRPTRWRHIASDARDPDSYDTANVGWRYETVAAGAGTIPDPRVYDTSRDGYGNQGHSYGVELDDAQKSALVEYLKML